MISHKIEVLFLISLLLWCWTSPVSCNDDELDKHDLIDKYLSVRGIETGLENKIIDCRTKEELNNLPVDELKKMMSDILNEVECSYLYSSIYHLEIFKSIVKENKVQSFIDQLVAGDYFFSFAEESKLMLKNVYYNKSSTAIDPIWLSYTHFQDIDGLNSILLNIRGAQLLIDLDDVIEYLEEFTEQSCLKENKYNSRYEQSSYYNDLKPLVQISIYEKVMLSCTNKDSIMGLIKAVSGLHDDVVGYFEKNYIFLDEVFLKESTMEVLIKQYAKVDNWSEVWRNMRADYLCVDSRLTLGTRIKCIANFQRKFVDLLEIIVLQSAWVHLARIQTKLVSSTSSGKSSQPQIIDLLNYLSVSLVEFVDYIAGSPHFTGVIDMLNKAISNESQQYEIDEKELTDQMENVLSTLDRMYKSFYNCKPMFMKSTETIVIPSRFLNYLKDSVLWNIDFRLIKSYIDFSNEFEKWNIQKKGLPATDDE